MFSEAPEMRLRYVRGFLALLWMVLILSLFWDPITARLTDPANQASPFRLKNTPVYVQGQALPQAPYQMGVRIFWTMLIPIVPFFLLFFGHEAWRRICPLSFMTQIPQYLGIQIKKKKINRHSGRVEKSQRLLTAENWLGRNYWYVQFFLLFFGISSRLVYTNSDRTMLAVFLLGIIAMALVTGFLFGGKTWCNYICPISPVQKIYTEPRGLFESQAHKSSSNMISQSTCRTPGKKEDQMACVGCISNCPDIDSERNYWETLFDNGRRTFYYGYHGLVLGFYTYYYLYSGNWDYYFSGAWTHEAGALNTLLSPGFYFNGVTVNIPKIIAAPLSLAVFIAASITFWSIWERIYRAILGKDSEDNRQKARHNTYMIAAFATFNTFYFFGGRPNLNLLPPIPLKMVDMTIFICSSIWMFRNIRRDRQVYKRETLVSSLRKQLQKLQFNFSKVLEGRSLEQLSTDEVYILAKTLPGFNHEQKIQVYRDIVRDSLVSGKSEAANSLEVLREVRLQMELSDEDHRNVLSEIQMEMSSLVDLHSASKEQWLRLNNYRIALEELVRKFMETGLPLRDINRDEQTRRQLEELRIFHDISEEEHSELLSVFTGDQKILIKQAKSLLDQMKNTRLKILSLTENLHSGSGSLKKMLVSFLEKQRSAMIRQQMNLLVSMDEQPGMVTAAAMHNLSEGETRKILESSGRLLQGGVSWAEKLGTGIMEALRTGKSPVTESEGINLASYAAGRERPPEAVNILEEIIRENDPVPTALSLLALEKLHKQKARSIANSLTLKKKGMHWLVREAAETLLGINLKFRDKTNDILEIIQTGADGTPISKSFQKPEISIGKSPANDIVIINAGIADHHAILRKTAAGYELRDLGSLAGTAVDGTEIRNAEKAITKGAEIIPAPGLSDTRLTVNWRPAQGEGKRPDYHILETDTITIMLYLFESQFFNHLSADILALLSKTAEVRIYKRGSVICRKGEPSDKIFVIGYGRAEVILERTGSRQVVDQINRGESIGEMGIFSGQPRSTTVVASDDESLLISISGTDLMSIVEENSMVARSFLNMLSQRQQSMIDKYSKVAS